ncbi:hypothetical protein CN692_18210 [Bacillus sp. AFS002410]|uniref:hypothetical protein n=1 Tax=Bacillus sp. AFS002410 TaxID=2033481 RepID=UPI000BF06229|nr:hypothetical protein [Bacillus sp. AFS002410]PEJ56271.1 hypothetical protein CN692_18210 [Bacillus sp. AFS002410]
MEDPIFLYKNKPFGIILMDVILLSGILGLIACFIIGIVKMDWLFIVMTIIFALMFYFLFIPERKKIRGYVAVYSNNIIEKKKTTKEVKLNDVIEVRYIKKEEYIAKQPWNIDYLQFYLNNHDEPILIQPSFGGTVAPYNMNDETKEILSFIRGKFPDIKVTKEK